jgi:hypothetical protein
MKVIVKTLKGEKFPIEIEASATVEQIKAIIVRYVTFMLRLCYVYVTLRLCYVMLSVIVLSRLRCRYRVKHGLNLNHQIR